MTQLHQSAMGLVNALEARQRLGLMKQEEDRRARLSDLQMRGLQREEDYQTGLQNAMSNPGTMPAQSITSFAPATEQNFTPATGSLAAMFPQQNNMQPQVSTIDMPKSRLQAGQEFAESQGRFSDVKEITNLRDTVAKQKAQGDPETYYKNAHKLDIYGKYINYVKDLSKTAGGREQLSNVDKMFQGLVAPEDSDVFNHSSISFSESGAFQPAPDGGYIWTKEDGTQMHISAGATSPASEFRNGGKESREKLVDRTGKTVAYTNDWHPVQSQVPKVTVNTGKEAPLAQTTFVDPKTGNPLVYDKGTGTYKVATVEGSGVAPKPAAMSPEAATRAQQFETVVANVPKIREMVFNPDGTVNYQNVGMGAVGMPYTKGREMDQLVTRTIEQTLRIATGAAAPDSEVKNYRKMFAPQVGDTKDQITAKLVALEEFAGGAIDKFNVGRSQGAKNQASPSIKPVPKGGTIRYNAQGERIN